MQELKHMKITKILFKIFLYGYLIIFLTYFKFVHKINLDIIRYIKKIRM